MIWLIIQIINIISDFVHFLTKNVKKALIKVLLFF